MPARKKLTAESVLGCIGEFQRVGPVGPTQREIAALLDVSVATIHTYLHELEAAGKIERSTIRGYIAKGA